MNESIMSGRFTKGLRMDDAEIRILFLADNPSDAKAVMKELDKCRRATPILVEHVERISLALEYLQKKEYDIILTDLKLPDSDGLETATHLLEQAPKIPLIVLTATYEQEDLALEAIRRGAQDYLFKDKMDGALLIRVIRYAIERKRAEAVLHQKIKELAESNEKLEQFNILAAGREQRMVELKVQVNELSTALGRPAPYDLSLVRGGDEFDL